MNKKKAQTTYYCLSTKGNRYTDTNYNDYTYGLRLPLHI